MKEQKKRWESISPNLLHDLNSLGYVMPTFMGFSGNIYLMIIIYIQPEMT